MKHRKKTRREGVVTVFLALCLMILFSFLCTCLQSARLAGSRYLFAQATGAMAESIFGAYDTDLWQQYRILALTDRDKAAAIAADCKKVYEAEEGLYHIRLDSWEFANERTLTDEGASFWQKSVLEYMKYEIPADLLSMLWEQADLAGRLSNLKQYIQNFRELMKPILEAEKQIKEMETRFCEATELLKSCKELVEEMGVLIHQMELWKESAGAVTEGGEIGTQGEGYGTEAGETSEEGVSGDGSSDEVPEEDTSGGNISGEGVSGENGSGTEITLEMLLSSFQRCADIMKKMSRERSDWEDMLGRISNTITDVQKLQSQLNKVIEDLHGEKEQSWLTVIADIGSYADTLTRRLGVLSSLPDDLRKLIEAAAGIDQLRVPTAEEMLDGDGINQIMEWKSYLDRLQGVETIEPQETPAEGTLSDKRSLADFENLGEWLRSGVWQLLLPGAGVVSTEHLARNLDRSERSTDAGMLEQAYQNLVYGEYALKYTSDFCDSDAAGLRYETEYLIVGSDSDEQNLLSVLSALFAIRGAADLIYLLQDADSRTQAEAMSQAISAALGGILPATVAQIMLLTLWAMGEALCDVRGLIAGKSVPMWKTDATWTLSWENLWKLANNTPEVGNTFLEGADGMKYADYLRLLLFVIPIEDKCYRTMEVAEENLSRNHAGLRLDQAIYQAEIQVEGVAAGRHCSYAAPYGY